MAATARLYDMSREALTAWLRDLGEPRYRADQLWHWAYGRLAASFDEMSSLPAGLRARLGESATLDLVATQTATRSDDGMAEKILFRLVDGQMIETVLMHYVDPADEQDVPPATATSTVVPQGRHTVCLSTQAGCAMGCVFCATGQMGFVRDLSRGECLAQLVVCARRLRASGERLTNVVFMGMGEPLANWEATEGTIETATDPDGLALSPRRITVSTVGLVPAIHRLAASRRPVRLAVSLHAPDDALRSSLLPINATYPLTELLAACRAYQEETGRRVTFEYVLIRGVNDAPQQARRLARLVGPLRAHVNLIPLNPTAGSGLRPSRRADVATFASVLTGAGVAASVRMRRGIEIHAGCGQLRSRASRGSMGRSIAPVEPTVAGSREDV